MEFFVYELGVDEEYRGRGVATALLLAVEALARDRGCDGLWVATEPDNVAAWATYERAGFASAGASAIMTKTLA
jgi:ribosomal protein S18 acetylase RimI-like enzyme